MADLTQVLRETGTPVCAQVVREITRSAGWRWRKARKVLTSTDPEYREGCTTSRASWPTFTKRRKDNVCMLRLWFDVLGGYEILSARDGAAGITPEQRMSTSYRD